MRLFYVIVTICVNMIFYISVNEQLVLELLMYGQSIWIGSGWSVAAATKQFWCVFVLVLCSL